MPDAQPRAMPNPPLPGGEPASHSGIGIGMSEPAPSEPAPSNFAASSIPQAESPEFDAWLRGHLVQLHAGVLAEPVPDRLLRLLGGIAD